ncbi:MAG: hypothetical protein WC735_02105 [Candidatus Paceibacterota bacterium]|jgi:hypothetical protein
MKVAIGITLVVFGLFLVCKAVRDHHRVVTEYTREASLSKIKSSGTSSTNSVGLVPRDLPPQFEFLETTNYYKARWVTNDSRRVLDTAIEDLRTRLGPSFDEFIAWDLSQAQRHGKQH